MVMLNLARQLRSFEYRPEKGRFRGYMGRAVANAISRYYRSPRPERDGLDTSVAAGVADRSEPELDHEWEVEWMHHHYRLAMQTVRGTADPKSVEVFEHLLAGESTDAVARRFAMSREAVHKVKQRVRDRLKELIARQVHEEDDVGLG